ncbi:MAG TPA: hypothetical protein DHW02_17935 [Ktedonobacter sp.]|nr:hypothetical protein [Ktedonobacter sp.]
MMKQLRGHNLAHPGCLIGITVGLSLGIIIAGVLAVKFGTPYNTVLLIWFGMTIGLGIIGWFVGSALSPRFPALPEDEAEPVESTPSSSEATFVPSTKEQTERKA